MGGNIKFKFNTDNNYIYSSKIVWSEDFNFTPKATKFAFFLVLALLALQYPFHLRHNHLRLHKALSYMNQKAERII